MSGSLIESIICSRVFFGRSLSFLMAYNNKFFLALSFLFCGFLHIVID